MTNNTDKQVQELFKIVQQRKQEIAKAEKPNWITNCSFGYDKDSSQRYNIQTMSNVDDLISILAFLMDKESSFNQAAKELDVDNKFTWMNYSVEDWKSDIHTRINKIQISKKKNELETLEGRLDKLISPELKAEMELAEISKLLA